MEYDKVNFKKKKGARVNNYPGLQNCVRCWHYCLWDICGLTLTCLSSYLRTPVECRAIIISLQLPRVVFKEWIQTRTTTTQHIYNLVWLSVSCHISALQSSYTMLFKNLFCSSLGSQRDFTGCLRTAFILLFPPFSTTTLPPATGPSRFGCWGNTTASGPISDCLIRCSQTNPGAGQQSMDGADNCELLEELSPLTFRSSVL